jgi:glycosyltransferase involved in cell wall biosynthesis
MNNEEKKLTIVIPFANEGSEVENTLKSIFEYSNDDVDVIVINDASDDGFDYLNAISKYDVTYVENKQRLGVAASRELGVELCKTDYFLLLDAHMRFYNDKWVERITTELTKNPRTLLCAQTKVLRKKDGEVIEKDNHSSVQYGAYINYYVLFHILEPEWTSTCTDVPIAQEGSMILIPCVLGAAYACSKKYWQYLRGLEGLLSYGNDEVLISLKVWLEGGTCKLLKDVEVGHIYREASPYVHISEDRIYNRLYISYLLLPVILRKKIFAVERFKSPELYLKASHLFYENFDFIKEMKIDLSKKLTEDFYSHEKFNRGRKPKEKDSLAKKERIILKHISYIVRHIDLSEGIGIMNGKMGILILLYHYAKYSKNTFISRFADSLLEEITDDIPNYLSLNMSNGILGIGWGIEYLSQNTFITGDTNVILSDFDIKIMETTPSRMYNYDLYYGFGGIVRYLLARLYSIKKNNKKNPFTPDFLREVFNKSKEIIENKEDNNCPETYIEYILYFENKKEIDPPSIYDITILPSWNKYSKTNKSMGLNGLVGFCLEYLLT